MAISQAMATSFKQELMQALHDFDNPGGNTFKISMYTSSATLGASTTAYTSTNEVTGTNYTAGGQYAFLSNTNKLWHYGFHRILLIPLGHQQQSQPMAL